MDTELLCRLYEVLIDEPAPALLAVLDKLQQSMSQAQFQDLAMATLHYRPTRPREALVEYFFPDVEKYWERYPFLPSVSQAFIRQARKLGLEEMVDVYAYYLYNQTPVADIDVSDELSSLLITFIRYWGNLLLEVACQVENNEPLDTDYLDSVVNFFQPRISQIIGHKPNKRRRYRELWHNGDYVQVLLWSLYFVVQNYLESEGIILTSPQAVFILYFGLIKKERSHR